MPRFDKFMKNILIIIAVFLASAAITHIFIQVKSDNAPENSSAAAISKSVIPYGAEIIQNATGTQMIVKHHGVLVYFVVYGNNGFNPKNFEMPVGSSARFVNYSDKAMRVFSKDKKYPYGVLDQSFSIKKGEYYSFNFTTKGLWEFYNLNNPRDEGSIRVY